MKVQTNTLGQWITMPIRYEEEMFFVMDGEIRYENREYKALCADLSARTLRGEFAHLNQAQREKLKNKPTREERVILILPIEQEKEQEDSDEDFGI